VSVLVPGGIGGGFRLLAGTKRSRSEGTEVWGRILENDFFVRFCDVNGQGTILQSSKNPP
jgi:hypothetical protein